jgi:hypothetical protein
MYTIEIDESNSLLEFSKVYCKTNNLKIISQSQNSIKVAPINQHFWSKSKAVLLINESGEKTCVEIVVRGHKYISEQIPKFFKDLFKNYSCQIDNYSSKASIDIVHSKF